MKVSTPTFDRLVIIESPYGSTDDAIVTRNERYLHTCLRDCLTRGDAPFASHGLYPGPLDDRDPHERAMGINAGFRWRSVAHATLVYVDYGISPGMEKGIAHAKGIGHTIEYRSIYAGLIDPAELGCTIP